MIKDFKSAVQNPDCIEPFNEEITCIEHSDLIVLNSPHTLQLFKILYPEYENKIFDNIVDTSKLIMTYEQEKDSKCFHLLACCSCFSRKEKNMMFLLDLFQHDPFLKECTKCFIGIGSEKFKNLPHSYCLPLLSHEEVAKYMNMSQLLLIPSFNEANSNTIREALHYDCLPVITKNVGYWECFPTELVCDSFEFDEWTMKIKYALKNYNDLLKIPIDFSRMSIHVDEFLSKILNIDHH
jgi:hypothetical protein